MHVTVLGSFSISRSDESRDAGTLDLGSYKQRSLLALLVIHRGEVVSTDRIIDDLWGSDASPNRKNALHVYLSNLRKTLDPGRESRTDESLLLTRPPGYVIPAEGVDVDSDEFERLSNEGKLLIPSDPGTASIVLGEALALWHGHPYEAFTYEDFAQVEILRLSELRLATVEARIDADLARGLDREIVGELVSLGREHPLRERFTGQLMLALYRSGRQAEALRTYQDLRARLVEELGLDPSAPLQRLEERIVLGDSSLVLNLAGEEHTGGRAKVANIRGYEIREVLGEGPFGTTYRAFQPAVGREVAIKVIRAEVADDPGFIRRFDGDVRTIAELGHDNVVPVYDHWREPGAAYLVMQLMQGGSFAQRVAMRPMPEAEVAVLVDQLADAVGSAHKAGVIHGGITPANVLFDAEGNAFLADFGIGSGSSVLAEVSHVEGTGSQIVARSSMDTAADCRAIAAIAAQALAGRQGEFPELLVGMSPRLAASLGGSSPVDGRNTRCDVLEWRSEILDALHASATTVPTLEVRNPYKGLRSFSQLDADDFFGRERQIQRLVAKLGAPGRAGRFVAVVGPSGSGKSSLVRAGLLPALRADAITGSSGWFIVEMVPGQHPFESLELALRQVAVRPPASMLDALAGKNGIPQVVDAVLPDDGSQLILVVDQLEELFTHTLPGTAERFMSALSDTVTLEGSRVKVVCTLRADFYDRPLMHRNFGALLRDGTEVITPLSPGDLEQAITGPAERCGVRFDPALVAQMITDVVDRPAALPLLQYALTELFETRDRDVVSVNAYQNIGGALGALVQRAESIYGGLDPSSRAAAQQIFLRLVTVGASVENDTRRRVLVSELTSMRVTNVSVQGVIDLFGRHRLLTFDRDAVTRSPSAEISHEALLSEWTRLQGWIEDARADLSNRRRLAEALAEWDGENRDDAYLLRGGRLEQLASWAAATTLALSDEEQRYVDASVALRDQAAIENRERDQERTLALQRSRRRLFYLLVAIGFALVVGSLAVLAFTERQQTVALAAQAENQSVAARLAEQAIRQIRADPQLALLLGLAAAEASVDLDELPIPVEEAMHLSLQSARIPYPAEVDKAYTAFGPAGLVGYFSMESSALSDLMISGLDRGFSADECEVLAVSPCSQDQPRPGDFPDLPPAVNRPEASLEGTTIRFLHPWVGSRGPDAEVEAFKESTGIGFSVSDEFPALRASESAKANTPWDVVILPQPGEITKLDEELGLVDLSTYLDPSVIRSTYGDYLYDLVNTSDRLIGFPIDVDLKSLVLYPRDDFEAAGYKIPGTWDELIALSDQMVEGGDAPWCLAYGSGDATGWVGTDWIEGLVLRLEGGEYYDAWVQNDVAFDDGSVVEAASMLEQILETPGYVVNGRGAVNATPWFIFSDQMFIEDGTRCWLNYGADFSLFPDIAEDVGFFVMPPIERGGVTPVFGGGNMTTAMTDRPEVRVFVEFMASAEFGSRFAGDATFISPHPGFDPANYGPANDVVANARRSMAAIVGEALARDEWRFDASDIMPSVIGSFAEDGGPGAFWFAMTQLADGDITALEAMSQIEQAWSQLDTGG